MRSWEKQEAKRVQHLEDLRKTWETWQEALALQEYRYLLISMEQAGLVTFASTPKGYNAFWGFN